MSIFKEIIDREQWAGGSAFNLLAVDAAGNWTDQRGNNIGTTATSGIVKLRSPGAYMCTSALADAGAIVYLPPAAAMPLAMILIVAVTGATGGDISVYDQETGSEISTYGDMDADLDRAIFISNGLTWDVVLEIVA